MQKIISAKYLLPLFICLLIAHADSTDLHAQTRSRCESAAPSKVRLVKRCLKSHRNICLSDNAPLWCMAACEPAEVLDVTDDQEFIDGVARWSRALRNVTVQCPCSPDQPCESVQECRGGECSTASATTDSQTNTENSDFIPVGIDYPVQPAGDFIPVGGYYPSQPAGDFIPVGGNYASQPSGDFIPVGRDYPTQPAGDFIPVGGNYPSQPAGDFIPVGREYTTQPAGDFIPVGQVYTSQPAGNFIPQGNNYSSSSDYNVFIPTPNWGSFQIFDPYLRPFGFIPFIPRTNGCFGFFC